VRLRDVLAADKRWNEKRGFYPTDVTRTDRWVTNGHVAARCRAKNIPLDTNRDPAKLLTGEALPAKRVGRTKAWGDTPAVIYEAAGRRFAVDAIYAALLRGLTVKAVKTVKPTGSSDMAIAGFRGDEVRVIVSPLREDAVR